MEAKVIHVKHEAKENAAFRAELFTTDRTQLTMMSLRRGEDIGEEVHDGDQLIYVVKGEGRAVLEGAEQPIEAGAIVCVPAGVRHNLKNTDDEPMKLFTIYAPPQHAPGTVHRTKADAEKAERQPAKA